jgi:Sulfotransferase family
LSDEQKISGPEQIALLGGEQFAGLGEAYLASIRARAGTAERITDKALDNSRHVGLIHLALPNARIIHTKRDAVDTCLSCYSKFFTGQHPYAYDLGELGRYWRAHDRMMQHWRDVLPEGTMLEVQYEELVKDFEAQARRIIAHCGLEWDDACLSFHESKRPVRTASVTQVRQPLYRSAVGRWRPDAETLAPLLAGLGIASSAGR